MCMYVLGRCSGTQSSLLLVWTQLHSLLTLSAVESCDLFLSHKICHSCDYIAFCVKSEATSAFCYFIQLSLSLSLSPLLLTSQPQGIEFTDSRKKFRSYDLTVEFPDENPFLTTWTTAFLRILLRHSWLLDPQKLCKNKYVVLSW